MREMSTIKEAWEQGEAILMQAGIENVRLDAQVLLCFVLHIERSVLYAYPERLVSPEQERNYLAMIERRRRHEPIAYITEHKEFYGRDFYVDPRVLIPRPETELLVEMALASVNRHLNAGQVPIVADIGTGSGAIPVTIALEVAHLPYLYACDISSDALEVARTNARLHQVEERIHFLQGDLVAPLPEAIDLLLANLPYVGTDETDTMTQDVLAYEPHIALFSGQHGLHLLQRFCIDVQRLGILNVGGEMLLEIGYQQGEVVAQWLREFWPSEHVSILKDYAGFDRFILARV
jgi:release factor glutamine methyltransferase